MNNQDPKFQIPDHCEKCKKKIIELTYHLEDRKWYCQSCYYGKTQTA